jgi:predicted nucleic acid-binding protein
MGMKTYKVEFVKIDKRYTSILVDAESRKEALALARSIQLEDIEESESQQAMEWKVKRNWSFWDFFDFFDRHI